MKLICNVHDEIIEIVNNIAKYMNYSKEYLVEIQNYSEDEFSIDKAEDSISSLEDAIWELSKISDLIYDAKALGQKMEDRLIVYKSTIEELGFTRVKK